MAKQNRNHSLALAFFSLLGAVLVAHALYHFTILPDRVATHFGFTGQPDAWGPKLVFFFWYMVLTGILAGLYAGSHRLLSPGNTNWLNIPNKRYWLSPEHVNETMRYLRTGLLLFGSGTLLFVLDLVHQSFQVSLGHAAKLTHLWTSIALYATFCVAWITALYKRFGNTR